MLDRTIIEQLLDWEFEGLHWEIPEYISREALLEAFYQYADDDHYEWLKDNLRSFFDHDNPDWNRIRERIKASEQQ